LTSRLCIDHQPFVAFSVHSIPQVLAGLLPQIQTPVQIIAGARDPAVPPVNAEFLDQRLPKSRLDLIDAGHFTWEDAADEYPAIVTAWWSGGYNAVPEYSR
jgi:pimeloyl-ACP methyl ester carboxylesterase